MIIDALVGLVGAAGAPLVGGLVALAVVLVWMAFRPSGAPVAAQRLDGYLRGRDVVEAEILQRSFTSRAILPAFRKLLRALGRLAPKRNLEATAEMLLHAGQPGQLSVLDFYGLRLLLVGALGGGYYVLLGTSAPFMEALRNTLILGALGFMLPLLWLRSKVKRRQHDIERALPDALDMLTIGVEAGLGFESAMMRVGEKWRNALTDEFQRAVSEMRVGMTREEALLRMTERAGVANLKSFVAVLVQSSKLGVSIAEVLHTQAYQMRIKRRQRAEELARQAGIKMVFPLVFFIFPALFVVILGPAIPRVMNTLGAM